MSKQKYFIALILSLCFLISSSVFATETNVDLENAKETVEKKLPEVKKFWEEKAYPFIKKSYNEGIVWLDNNLPGVAKELREESQTLPIEILESLKSGWNWILDFFKR
jgi:hypothetical protein